MPHGPHPADEVISASRSPLRAGDVATALAAAGFTGPAPDLRGVVGSTNAEASALRDDLASVVAEEQVAGRGRRGRAWASPPGAGLWCSAVVRADGIPVARRTWLPLAAGLAASDAVRAAGVPCALKWPNDLVVVDAGGTRKLGGILVEGIAGDDARAVVGIGINVSMRREELPVEGATSLLLEGGSADRAALLASLLASLARWAGAWRDGDPGLAAAYAGRCATLGARVRAALPDGSVLEGTGEGIGDDGSLRIGLADGSSRNVAAGDVVHATI